MDELEKDSLGTLASSKAVDSEMTVSKTTVSETIVAAPVANRIAGVLQSHEDAEASGSSFEALTDELASAPEDYVPARALQALYAGEAEAALAICDSYKSEADAAPQMTSLSLPLIRGRALLALKRISEAAEEFHRVLGEDPECPAALKGLGDSHFAQNKEIIAFTYYERARELSGDYQALTERVHYSFDERVVEVESAPEVGADYEPPSVAGEVEPDPDMDTVNTKLNDGHVEDKSTRVVEAPAIEEILEQIIVRDSEEGDRETPSVSLTLKRGYEEAEPAEKQDEIEAPEPVEAVETDAAKKVVVATHPVELTERYDRPQRPVHYQTETMADLLLQQGYSDAALEIFRELVAKNPLPRLLEKLAKAESRQKRSR